MRPAGPRAAAAAALVHQEQGGYSNLVLDAELGRSGLQGRDRAFASANIAGAYAIHGIRVVDSQKGLFVSMPQNSYTTENGETRYSDVFHPITAQARTELYDKVLEAYEQKLEEGQEQDEGEEVSEEADQGMEQSM